MKKKTIEEFLKGLKLGILVASSFVLLIYSLSFNSNTVYLKGIGQGVVFEDVMDDVRSLHEVGEIADEQYYEFMGVHGAILEATYHNTELTKEMIADYNRVIKKLPVLDYKKCELSSKKDYWQGLQDGIMFKYYDEMVRYFSVRAKMIPENVYDAYSVRRNCLYSSEVSHENYEEFFDYVNKLLTKYVWI